MDSLRQLASRFKRPIFLWAAAALISELTVQWIVKDVWHSAGARWLTLLPLLPMLLFIFALVRTILHMDELQRRISIESMSVAFVLTLALALIFVGLERAGFYRPDWSELGTYMLFLWACAYIFCVRRYQ